MTLNNSLIWAENALSEAGIDSPRTDAEWILAEILPCSRSALHLRRTEPLSPEQESRFKDLIGRRAQRIPLQQLIGHTEFYGLPFRVSRNVLIPRPDTETLIEVALEHLRDHPSPRILDVGTGSGIIAITLAHELPDARVFALDISPHALSLTCQNAHLNNVSDRVTCLQSNLLSGLACSVQFHATVSNPPYIPAPDLPHLQPEVRDHDPHLALDGGPDGLTIYRKLIPQCTPHLLPDALLALEIGHNQAQPVTTLLSQHPELTPATVHRDLAGNHRVITTKKRPSAP